MKAEKYFFEYTLIKMNLSILPQSLQLADVKMFAHFISYSKRKLSEYVSNNFSIKKSTSIFNSNNNANNIVILLLMLFEIYFELFLGFVILYERTDFLIEIKL